MASRQRDTADRVDRDADHCRDTRDGSARPATTSAIVDSRMQVGRPSTATFPPVARTLSPSHLAPFPCEGAGSGSRCQMPRIWRTRSARARVEPQVRVGGERAEHPLELGDAVAQRVVVEEQQAGRLGDVEVGVDAAPTGCARRSAFSAVSSVASSPSDSLDEPAQLGAVGDQREQPVDARARRSGSAPTRRASAARRAPPCSGLVVGLRAGRPTDVIGRDTPVEKRPPTPAAVTAHDLATSPTVRITASVSASAATGSRATTSWLKPGDGRAGVARPHRLHPGAREPLLQRAHLVGRAGRLLVVLVGLGDHDHHRPRDVPAEGCRVRTASAGSPARPASGSRRNSARYLPSTAATACSLVMASAATVAARSSRCTSAAVSGRSGEKATSRPWSEAPGDDA